MKTRHALATLLALGGCLPPIHLTNAFSSRFGDNDRGRIAAVVAREAAAGGADRPTNGTGQPLVAAVVQGEHRAVAAYDVAAHRALWSQALTATSTPEILGDALVVEAVGGTHILDLATGATRGTVEHRGLELAGAARDGDTLVLCFAAGLQGGSRRSARVVAVDARTGGERWAHEVNGIVGRPAARAGLAFIPWDRQSLAVLDLHTGVEQARVRSTDDVLTWVRATPAGIFYGGRGVYQLTPASASGTKPGSAYLANPLTGVPGDPQVFRDAFLPTTGTRTARDKIRFGFLPEAGAGGHVTLHDNALYLAYFKDLLAVDATTGAVRWAQHLDEDAEALQVTTRGVFVVSGSGKVRGLDPRTGAVALVADLGVQVGAIAADLEGLALPATATPPDGGVREQLVALVRDNDNRLVPFRAWLVGLLARRPEPETTRDLLDLYTQRSIPNQLRQGIATALQSRRNGAQYLVAALQEHFDYLEGRGAPPLQVIAPTLVAMNAHDAVPGLLAHLLDHETPLATLPDVVTAVAALGEASVVPTLQGWVQLYKSDSVFRGADRVTALDAAVDAVFRHGDAATREWLQHLAQDATANPLLKTHIQELFTHEASEARTRATQATEGERQAALQAELNHLREAQRAVPETLGDDAVDEVWNGHIDEIRACAQGYVARNPTLNQIRVVVTLHGGLPPGLLTATPPAQSGGVDAAHPRHATTANEAMEWVHHQVAGLQAQHATVRLATYAPGDAGLRQCMDRAILPLELPAFRATRMEFRRVIDTRGARATSDAGDSYNGMGLDAQGRELPWWLVSAPSLVVEQPPAARPPSTAPAAPATPTVPAAAPTTAPGSRPATPTTPADAGAAPRGPAQRPWWEE